MNNGLRQEFQFVQVIIIGFIVVIRYYKWEWPGNGIEIVYDLKKEKKAIMMTPVKAVKIENQDIKKRNNSVNDLFSKAVQMFRRPIEPSFLIG